MGTANRNIMVVPCMVKNWLYLIGSERMWLSGKASCSRISAANNPASKKEDECGDDVALADAWCDGRP